MTQSPVIMWFRNDLRLGDNRALAAAVKSGAPVIALYILDDETPGNWRLGGAARWWLHMSLAALDRDLQARGNRLIVMRGKADELLVALAKQTTATGIYCSRAYEPFAGALESHLKARCEAMGVAFKRFGGALLCEPEDIRTKTGDVYKVYTPFWRALNAGLAVKKPLAAPSHITAATSPRRPKSLDLDALGLRPTAPDWAQGLRDTWTPGEARAHDRLAEFLDDALANYAEQRNRPDVEGTSRLSAHLHFGEITPGMCWYRAKLAAADKRGADAGLESFLKELVWREFSYTLLFHRHDLPEAPYRPEFARFPWKPNAAHLQAWQKGSTGYPIIDAGMRQLWQTGYMHNRVRMIVASFLVKDLLIPWQDGARWFWDTLVDADLASNAASWQWVAGSGADAAPYFRIFNPVTQGKTFDPRGTYVRTYCPELAQLPEAYIHAPWTAPPIVLKSSGVVLGQTYPVPIVDHAAARARALAAYGAVKAETAR